ncbi:extracellular solute-binding protein family 1 [Xenorhabdus vietnamensis]|uniref:Extracellular solute-binding protein family 1 n=1 Tax=Xenorhabdus vietnamensis TaxID=351656 RepID=A0A1Y2SHI6_9GAMM|nr:ABC transporter substrate-binding protein [Xenorhabdus vietnamensis]OTA17041.1 extracellular solute-binding protein family 1 [Xenorhabdus vietnamensis]
MKLNYLSTLIAIGLTTATLVSNANAAGRLTVYCSGTNALCETQTRAFSEKHNVKTTFIRSNTGSILAKIEAEKRNPQADVWYGGTLDPHSQAGELNLLQPYKSPNLDQIMPQFRDPAKRKGNYTSAVYMGILGFGVNTERLKEKNLPIPTCWKDLTKPQYRGEIQIADPQSSGTSYTALATFIQLWGEYEAFGYLQKLNNNISQYTKSGIAPARNTARGETAIGIGFLHDYSLEVENGAPMKLIAPCEGTGYEIGGVSIIKNARNVDNAKLFVDWVLSKEAQELGWKKGQSYQILTNSTAEASPISLKPAELNLINYNMEKYGSNEVRKELINKWLTEVKMGQ